MAILHRHTRQLGGELSTTAAKLLDELYANYARWNSLEQLELERLLDKDIYAKWRDSNLIAIEMTTSQWELLELAIACWALCEAKWNNNGPDGREYGWALQAHEFLLAIGVRKALPGYRNPAQVCVLPSLMAHDMVYGFVHVYGHIGDQGNSWDPLFKTAEERDTFLDKLFPRVESTFTRQVISGMQALLSGEKPGDRSD